MLNDLNDIQKRNNKFSYEEFFSKKYDTVNFRSASCIITDNQAITIINNNDGYDDHVPTLFSILKCIYDLNESNNISINRKQLIVEKYSDSLIMMRIMTGKYGKMIFITIPKKISNNQLGLLELYRDKYDLIIKTIEEQIGKSIICLNSQTFNSFNEVVEYAKTLVSDDVILPEDNHIIGNINNIESIKKSR